MVDDSLRNAAHEQALHAAKTPAADYHEVRFRLLGGAQDLAYRRARQEPSLGHRAPHLFYPPHLLVENLPSLLHALQRRAHPERHARELPGGDELEGVDDVELCPASVRQVHGYPARALGAIRAVCGEQYPRR